MVRTVHELAREVQSREIIHHVASWLDNADINEMRSLSNLGAVRAIAVPIGPNGAHGVLVVGTQRADFPGEEDRLLLTLVVRQAATALQCRRAEEARRGLLLERDESLVRPTLQFERMPVACILFDPRSVLSIGIRRPNRSSAIEENEVVGKSADLFLVPPSIRGYVQEISRRLATGDMSAHSTNENITK